MRGLTVVLLLLLCGGCSGDATTVDDVQPSGPATLLFAASDDGGGWEIWVEDVATGKRTNLTKTPPTAQFDADDRSPALSPDGFMIAYTSTADHDSDGAVDEEIFVMARDGGEQRRLTENDDIDVDPQWTPDGRIAFTTCVSSRDAVPDCRLDVISPDGTGRGTLSDGLGLAFGVAPAPDGERIAYVRYDEKLQPLGLFVRELDSGEERRIAGGGAARWSPDGEQLALLSARDKNGRCLFHDCVGHAPEVYVVDADGSEERRLTETTESEDYVNWTPDGKWLLVSRIRDEEDDYDLYALRPDGSCEVQLTDTNAWEWSPTWIGPTESLSC